MGANVTVTMVDNSEDRAWSMRIQPHVTELPSTPREQIELVLRRTPAAGWERTLISNERTQIDNRTSQLCYVRETSAQGDDIVSGWLFVPTNETLAVYMVFSVHIKAAHADRVKPILEMSFDTIRLQDITEVRQATKARLDAGKMLLRSLSPDRLKQLIGVNRVLSLLSPR